MDTMYACLTEANEWEGETWRFYIPVEGNEAALTRLSEALVETLGDDSPYRVAKKRLTAAEVETLVQTPNGDASYLPAHTQMAGRLALPEELPGDCEGFDNLLYKGGLRGQWSGLTVVAECPLDEGDEEEW